MAETDLHRLVPHLRRVICSVAESSIPIEVPAHQQVPHLSREICNVAESWIPFEVPGHQSSSTKLSEEKQSQLANLLSQFKNIFSYSEFGFVTFTALKLEIDTADAALIKERI